MKRLKQIFWGILILGLIAVLYFGGMIVYAMITDYEPALREDAALHGTARYEIETDSFTLLSWNIGYAGLGKESDFFL